MTVDRGTSAGLPTSDAALTRAIRHQRRVVDRLTVGIANLEKRKTLAIEYLTRLETEQGRRNAGYRGEA